MPEVDTEFLNRKWPLSKVFKNPSITNPALCYILLELEEIRKLLEERLGQLDERE